MNTITYRKSEIDTERLGEILAQSGFFADIKGAAQAVVKILAGSELGFGPMASMQGINIVKGKVSLSANLIGAAIQRSGKYKYKPVELTNEKCTLLFSDNDGATFESTFTLDDAKKAGIAGDMYGKFARNMLFSRALTNGARWFCPEVFNGSVYTPDELGADIDDEGNMLPMERPALPEAAYVPIKDQAPEADEDMVRNADETIWTRWLAAVSKAQGLGIDVQLLSLPVNRDKLKARGTALIAQIKEREAEAALIGREQPV